MKIIVPFFASLFLAAMTFAQEESPAPSESTAPTSEEKASATVETTPETSTSEATAPASQKKEETIATPAPAKAAKAEASAATTSSAKPAVAAKPGAATDATAPKMNAKNMSVKDMENAWEASVAKHDYATVEGFVAADFTGISSKNKFIGRSDVLADGKRDKDTYKSAKNEKLNVKMYGPNVAVVTGRAREVGTGKDGKAFDRTYLFTDTWMMRGGKWQCVASQISKIKG
jgi:ketosteroid isomerase-like protein